MKEYSVGMLPYKIVAWLSIAFFLFAAVMSWKAGQKSVTPFFLLFVGLGVFILSTVSHIKFTNDVVSVFSPFSEYRLKWEEIERVEYGTQGTLVLHASPKKRLVIPPSSMWSGSQKAEAYMYMIKIIESYSVDIALSNLADYKTQKNVKV